jgi:hypothetical protein
VESFQDLSQATKPFVVKWHSFNEPNRFSLMEPSCAFIAVRSFNMLSLMQLGNKKAFLKPMKKQFVDN